MHFISSDFLSHLLTFWLSLNVTFSHVFGTFHPLFSILSTSHVGLASIMATGPYSLGEPFTLYSRLAWIITCAALAQLSSFLTHFLLWLCLHSKLRSSFCPGNSFYTPDHEILPSVPPPHYSGDLKKNPNFKNYFSRTIF